MLFSPISINFCMIILVLNRFCAAYSLNQSDIKDAVIKYGMEQLGVKFMKNLVVEGETKSADASMTTIAVSCTDDSQCGEREKCVGEEGEKTCQCADGLGGENCHKLVWCEDTGKFKNCKDEYGKCEYNKEKRSIVCTCDNGKKFHYEENICKAVSCTDDSQCGEREKCVGEEGEKTCQCADGLGGENCDKQVWCEDTGKFRNCKDEYGNCEYSKEKRSIVCTCDNGKTFHPEENICKDDEGRNVCDEKNPCQNGGTCEQEDGKDNKCHCMEGFNGTNCEIIQWCQDNNEICGNTPCEYNEEVGSAFCSCKDRLYFDAKSKTCVALDKCLLARIKGNCNGDHETCDKMGNCICEENYAYNDDRTACEPDFCWKRSSKPRCGKNMECSEGDKSFSCFCKKDFWQIGANCVKVDKCTPGVSKCEHQCVNGNCSCCPGFKLNDDEYSCDPTKSDTECELDCGRGTCVKEGTIEKCVCPQISHVFRRGTCIDKCEAKELKEEECPKEMGCLSDEEFGYKCNCTGKYDFEDDDVHCKAKPMCSEGGGNEVCSLKGGLCEDNFALSEGYKCRCNFGYKENPKTHVCEHMCETAECHKKQALCSINAYNAVECICPPLLVEDTNGICNQLAKYSYIGDFSVPKRKYEVVTDTDSVRIKQDTSQDFNYAKLLKDFEDSMNKIFDGYKGASILNCIDEEDDWKCFLEIKLNEDPQGKINIISTPSVCLPFLYESYCLIPPDFITRRRKADDRQVFHKTNPCDERVIGKLCGYDTECKVSEPSGFKCVCKAGYFRRNSFVLAQDVLIDFCEDIDECLNPTICPNASTCFNLPGDYTCKCKDGYRSEEGKSVKRDGCRGLCDPNPCNNGICEVTKDYGIYCRCSEGFVGQFCQERVAVRTNKSTLLIGIIAFCVILIMLLSGTLGYVYLNKRKV